MRKVSKKQARKNNILSRIKRGLPKRCYFCGRKGNDLAHVLPRSIFGEYYVEEWNLRIACRECHDDYDQHRDYRSKQEELFKIAYKNVKDKDKGRVLKYFGKI